MFMLMLYLSVNNSQPYQENFLLSWVEPVLRILDICISSLENSGDPDQLASEKPADQDLHCVLTSIYSTLDQHITNSMVEWTVSTVLAVDQKWGKGIFIFNRTRVTLWTNKL